jgi:fimbrial chaperone protein
MSIIDIVARWPAAALRMPAPLSWRLGMLAALGFAPGAAKAVTISPVIVELSPAKKVVSVTVTNPSDQAVSFQAGVLAWSQPDGEDRYEDSNDLMVVPPIADIGAGRSQIFRVARRIPPGQREQAYRVVLEDVTDETAGKADAATVNIRVRHSLPVFVAATDKPRTEVRLGPCSATAAAGRDCLRLDNDGERYLVVKSLSLDSGGVRKNVPVGSRVLAGAWHEWTLDVPAGRTGPLQVKVDTSAGSFAHEIPALSK